MSYPVVPGSARQGDQEARQAIDGTHAPQAKEITIKMSMPREVFEDFVAPLTEADVEGMQRGPDGSLIPTSKTTALYKYKYFTRSRGAR